MLKAGITGGIGSGKSMVCQVFKTLGIPVFNADNAARFLMENDHGLIKDIGLLLGEGVYADGKLDRKKVSSIVFNQPEKLRKLNALVHPATLEYARKWMEQQHSPYILKEAALFFESGGNKDMDFMIGVFAPEQLRIERAMKRSQLSESQVRAIMSKQMDEAEKMNHCNFVITNDDITAVLPQVLALHDNLLSYAIGK